MAKKSAIEKNERRKKMVAKYENTRRELREKVVNESLSDEERYAAHIKLQKLPRDGSRIRVRSRCYITGRSRGNLQKFGLSRIAFREMASSGLIPGVTCLLYTSPSPRDRTRSRMPSSA